MLSCIFYELQFNIFWNFAAFGADDVNYCYYCSLFIMAVSVQFLCWWIRTDKFYKWSLCAIPSYMNGINMWAKQVTKCQIVSPWPRTLDRTPFTMYYMCMLSPKIVPYVPLFTSMWWWSEMIDTNSACGISVFSIVMKEEEEKMFLKFTIFSWLHSTLNRKLMLSAASDEKLRNIWIYDMSQSIGEWRLS